MFKFILLLVFIDTISGQCPYKHGGSGSGGHASGGAHPPDYPHDYEQGHHEPHHQQEHQHRHHEPLSSDEDVDEKVGQGKNFIQTTFIHLDSDDSSLSFTQDVIDQINILRLRLKTAAKITIDNENIDCNDGGFPQCQEYPLKGSYHFLIVEDSSQGAAVYSLEHQYNTNSGKVEAAILDALSRHSTHSLMSYSSKAAEKEVGFVRELTPKELEAFAKQNKAAAGQDTSSSMIVRSPTELNLINTNILEVRDMDVPKISAEDALEAFSGADLNNLLETDERFVFVLFWTRVSSTSIHALFLWKEAAEILKNNQKTVLGSVACHDEIDVCKAFAISHQDKHTILVYKNGKKLTAQFNIRDSEFYVEWVKMVISGESREIDSEDELKQARQGLLPHLPELGRRKAVTIGRFKSEDSPEFATFKTVSKILNGRYHFVYNVDVNVAEPSVTTFRPFEKTRRNDFNGKFDVPSLVKHVTQSSNPSILDFGHGFTGDLVYYSPKDLILLIHTKNNEFVKEFSLIASKTENNAKFTFAQIDTSKSVDISSFLFEINSNNDQIPLICLVQHDKISCLQNVESVDASIMAPESYDNGLVHLMCPKKPHPLKYIQLEHVNSIFGSQEIRLLPEPKTLKSHLNIPNHHGHVKMGDPSASGGAIGGCPMMAHLNSPKEEL